MPINQIKTIQFQNYSFKNREAFLDFTKSNIVEFALHRQKLFVKNHCNAAYFHKVKNSNTENKIVIHRLVKDNILTIRAYTKEGIKTLNYWFKLYKEAYPTRCKNVIESTEYFEFNKLTKPIYYTSYNWAPFSKVMSNKDGFHLNKIGNIITNNGFKEQLVKSLKGQLLKELFHIKEDFVIKIIHFKMVNSTKKVIAFDTKPRTTTGKPLEHHIFKVTIAVNVQLPSYFSLGQRIAYGLGVFERDYSYQINHLHHENKNTNLKSNKKE